jgi:hypothetical protein
MAGPLVALSRLCRAARRDFAINTKYFFIKVSNLRARSNMKFLRPLTRKFGVWWGNLLGPLKRSLSFAVNRSATQSRPDFVFNSFRKKPFLHLNVQQMRSCSAPESVHQTQVFSVLLAFLSLVNGWADRFGRRGDQRVKRTKFCI